MLCIQVCSSQEWKAFKEIMDFNESEYNVYPFGEYVITKINNEESIFYYSGETKTRSAAACQYAIDKWNPKIIIVLGTAGGVGKDIKTLDLIIANQTVQYDCITRMGNQCQIFYELFTTEIDNSWIEFNRFPEKLIEGIIATGDQNINYQVLKELEKENVLAADWESGSIAHICSLNQVKCCIIRGVSDKPDDEKFESEIKQGEDYRKNTPIIMQKLLKIILPQLITMVSSHAQYILDQHFCTCRDYKCKNHPRNHSHGCDPCIKKNLNSGEIPACFFRAVSPEINDLRQFTYESFADFVIKHKSPAP